MTPEFLPSKLRLNQTTYSVVVYAGCPWMTWMTCGSVAKEFIRKNLPAHILARPVDELVYGEDYAMYIYGARLGCWRVASPGAYTLLVSLRDVPPRPTTLFNIREMPPAAWAWVVEARRRVSFLDGTVVWGDYHHNNVWLEPYGFGDRASAVRRMEEVTLLDPEVTAGTTEYRVSPKYIGYKPDGESWYRVTYPSLSDSTK